MVTTKFVPIAWSTSLLTIMWLRNQSRSFSSSQGHANRNLQDASPEGHCIDFPSLIQRKGGQSKREEYFQTDGWHSLVQSQSHGAHQGEQGQLCFDTTAVPFAKWELKSFTFNLIALVGSSERKCCKNRLSYPTWFGPWQHIRKHWRKLRLLSSHIHTHTHMDTKTHLVVDVHAGVQQHLHHRQVSVPRGQMQRRVFLGVTAEQVGVGTEQQLDYLQAAV